MKRFYLGTHEPSWLARSTVPLFISAVRLRRQKKLPRAICPWALDSGGFSELSIHGRWRFTAKQFVVEVRAWIRQIGVPDWVAIQDWMCEAFILAKTGLSIAEHQRRTLRSFLELRDLAPEIAWAPVLQGWTVDDYLRHADDYQRAGVDLGGAPIVGVGSVCRRQGTLEGAAIMRATSKLQIPVHAFGIKTQGLGLFGERITSADSMAWSYVARRRNIQLPGRSHKTCANCFRFAMQWHAELHQSLGDKISGELRQTEMPW